jgi:hypothetical protein
MANNPPSYVRTVGLAESALVDDVERPCELRVDGSMAGVSKEGRRPRRRLYAVDFSVSGVDGCGNKSVGPQEAIAAFNSAISLLTFMSGTFNRHHRFEKF